MARSEGSQGIMGDKSGWTGLGPSYEGLQGQTKELN